MCIRDRSHADFRTNLVYSAHRCLAGRAPLPREKTAKTEARERERLEVLHWESFLAAIVRPLLIGWSECRVVDPRPPRVEVPRDDRVLRCVTLQGRTDRPPILGGLFGASLLPRLSCCCLLFRRRLRPPQAMVAREPRCMHILPATLDSEE